MSWDCPYWVDEICKLNDLTCKPGKGKCILKGRFQIQSGEKKKEQEKLKREVRKRDHI
jgi:hypothetical protein